MITFFVSVLVLIAGYFLWGKVMDKVIGVDPQAKTPAVTMADGVDYVPMKPWRIFLIQFLNIAGVGPICGAIMGARYGVSSFIWIVFGSIFAGAVHDYIAGMISLRNKGCSLPVIHVIYLEKTAKRFISVFTIILMILVGVVFVNTPVTLLQNSFTPNWNMTVWIVIIMAYYLIATLLPIDKIIGKIYPVFGFLLLSMAVAIVVAFVLYRPEIPEIWQGLQNTHPDAEHYPIFPMMCISIACGAISGFHATQSPLMARCMVNEKQGRPIFYGAMITEGIVALIWAAAATYFFSPASPVSTDGLGGPAMVSLIANTWFAPVIASITVLGVISAAISTGDTALRSGRMIIADLLHIEQKSISKRLLIAIPLFFVTTLILIFSIKNSDGFDVIWRYFAWLNQVLAQVTLYAVTVALIWEGKNYWVTLIPALFMTMVCSSYIFVAPEGITLPRPYPYIIGGFLTLLVLVMALAYRKVYRKNHPLCK